MLLKRGFVIVLAAILLLAASSSALADNGGNIVLRCWVYYNGVQEKTFEAMVQSFNNTVGVQQGIFVEYSSKSNIGELDAQLQAAAMEEPGAEPMPDLFAAYSDTTWAMMELDKVADIAPYLTADEMAEYIDAYVEEGRMGKAEGFYIFPMAKSTELLGLNQTAWDGFQAATGADISQLATWEGIVALGKMYYEWTDGLTPDKPNDGQAFFGRDALANYMLIGAVQLGGEIFHVVDEQTTLQFDKAVMRRLWDNYYVPFMSGWFTSEGRYSSDDIKTGKTIAQVGSTSGAMYLPDEVTYDDGTTQSIKCSIYPPPNFEGTQPLAVQQGAGFVVSKSAPEREKAAVTFLRWFTEPERNSEFAIKSGYLPVTKVAIQEDSVARTMENMKPQPLIQQAFETGVSITSQYGLYTNKPFAGGYQARTALSNSLMKAAKAGNEQRLALMQGGMPYDEAVTKLNTDELFQTWYEGTQRELELIIQEAQ